MRRRFDEDLSPSYDSSCDSCSGFFRLCKRTGNDHYHYYPERNYALNFWRILRTGQTAESSRGIFLPEVIAQALFSRQTNGYSSMQLLLLAAAPPALLPIRILAAVALFAVMLAFVYVLRHLRRIENTIIADDLVPNERGPRNNILLIICAIPIAFVSLLLFLIFKA